MAVAMFCSTPEVITKRQDCTQRKHNQALWTEPLAITPKYKTHLLQSFDTCYYQQHTHLLHHLILRMVLHGVSHNGHAVLCNVHTQWPAMVGVVVCNLLQATMAK